MFDLVERNARGRFEPSPDSLHPKTIGLRLRKALYQKFLDAADSAGKRPTELAREIIEEWLTRNEGDQHD